jgi:hypothetical protein
MFSLRFRLSFWCVKVTTNAVSVGCYSVLCNCVVYGFTVMAWVWLSRSLMIVLLSIAAALCLWVAPPHGCGNGDNSTVPHCGPIEM